MLENYNFIVTGIGNIPISAYSLQEAEEILQAYIDKHSLNWTVEWQNSNSK